jgi:hypothetical protein
MISWPLNDIKLPIISRVFFDTIGPLIEQRANMAAWPRGTCA